MSRFDRRRSHQVQRVHVEPRFRPRIGRFLGSPGHVVGTLLAIVGVILLDADVIHGIEAFAVIAVLYVTGYFVASRPRVDVFAPAGTRSGESSKVNGNLDELLAYIRMRVADDVYRRVQSIRDAVVFTLEHAGTQYQTDANIHLVRQTATTYLPEALAAYLALPRPYAERQPVEGGRTSHDILLEQLYIMDVKARQVAEEVVRRDSEQLVKHGRFVADRYQPNSLEVPASVRR